MVGGAAVGGAAFGCSAAGGLISGSGPAATGPDTAGDAGSRPMRARNASIDWGRWCASSSRPSITPSLTSFDTAR